MLFCFLEELVSIDSENLIQRLLINFVSELIHSLLVLDLFGLNLLEDFFESFIAIGKDKVSLQIGFYLFGDGSCIVNFVLHFVLEILNNGKYHGLALVRRLVNTPHNLFHHVSVLRNELRPLQLSILELLEVVAPLVHDFLFVPQVLHAELARLRVLGEVQLVQVLLFFLLLLVHLAHRHFHCLICLVFM